MHQFNIKKDCCFHAILFSGVFIINLTKKNRARSLAVSNVRSETKSFQLKSGC